MKKLNYDKAMLELQSILEKLRSEDIEIEALKEYIERANYLTKYCRERLRSIETEIEQIEKIVE